MWCWAVAPRTLSPTGHTSIIKMGTLGLWKNQLRLTNNRSPSTSPVFFPF